MHHAAWTAAALLCVSAGTSGEAPASDAEVNRIFDEIRVVPPSRPARGGVDASPSKLPAFPAKVLSAYRADVGGSMAELLKRRKADPEALAKQHPARAAVLDAIEALQKTDRLVVQGTLKSPISDKQKAALLQLQKAPAQMIFELENTLSDVTLVSDQELAAESSKRWRAHYDLVHARLVARIAYLYEYAYALGQVRRDAMPPLLDGANGWRLAARDKLQVPEPKAKTYARQAANAWRDIQKNYSDTPWAFTAQRDSQVALGLEWRPNKE